MFGKIFRSLLVLASFLVVLIIAAKLAFPLPSLEGRLETTAIPASEETTLGRVMVPLVEENPGTSGIVPLGSGLDAFSARMILARASQQSLDVQYYIWQRDLTGLLLLDALRDAAERGVRVRLLLDDNGVPGMDPDLAALDALPNMEVRLFNPFTFRNPRMLSYGFDFPRLNRRMHNKSFTADGIATIVGGRNIGDIYFSHGPDVQYFDLDLLAIGPAATDVSTDFDAYWASGSSYPIDRLVEAPPDGTAGLDAALAAVAQSTEAVAFHEAVRTSTLVRSLIDGSLEHEWVRTELFSDDPAKGLGLADEDQLLIADLAPIFQATESSIDLISAYFIPGPDFTEFLASQAGEGIRTRVLTNSLVATDVLSVHSGWVKYRETLLDAGVEVLELQSSGGEDGGVNFGILGSSTTSLHAKSFAIDEQRLFIGSFNFDPRSADLNCEMGLLVDSPRLATGMARGFDSGFPSTAYQLERSTDGALVWYDPQTDTRHFTEPGSSFFSSLFVTVLGKLPVEWML